MWIQVGIVIYIGYIGIMIAPAIIGLALAFMVQHIPTKTKTNGLIQNQKTGS